MTGESSAGGRERRTWTWVIGAGVAVLLAGGIVWGVVSERAGGGPAAASTPTPTWTTPTPQPTAFATPTAGATAVASKPATTEEVPIDETATVDDVDVEVTGLAAGSFSSTLPGEASGDSITVSVTIRNGGSGALDIAGASVNLEYGGDDRTPAIAVTQDGDRVWPTSVAAGAEATADFTFVAPLAATGDIRVTVDLLASAPDIVFAGPRP